VTITSLASVCGLYLCGGGSKGRNASNTRDSAPSEDDLMEVLRGHDDEIELASRPSPEKIWALRSGAGGGVGETCKGE